MVAPQVSPQVVGSPEARALAVRPPTVNSGRQLQEFGQGLASVGAALSDIAIHQQRERDDAIVNDRDALFSDAIYKHFDSADGGYMHTLGEAAVTGNARETAFEAVEKAREDLSASTENAYQQRRFQEKAVEQLQRLRNRADNHYVEQTRVFSVGRAEARIEAALRDAASVPVDSDDFLRQRDTIIENAGTLARLAQVSDEQAEHIKRVALSRLHSATINGLLDRGSPMAANAYLAKYGTEMTAGAFAAAQHPIKEGEERAMASRVAIELQSLPRAVDRHEENERRFQDGQYSDETYQRVGQMIDRDEERKNRQLVQDTLDMRREAIHILDADRDSDPTRPARPLEELLTPAQLTTVKEFGLYQELKDYEVNGRRITSATGSWLLKDITDESLRGQPWSEIENTMWKHLSKGDLEDLQERHAKVNTLPMPKTVHGFDSEFKNTMLNRLLGPKDDKASPEEKARRDEVWTELVSSVTGQAPKNEAEARTLMDEVVKLRLREKVQHRSSGEVALLSLLDQEDAVNNYEITFGESKVELQELRIPEVKQHAMELGRQLIAQFKRYPSPYNLRQIEVIERGLKTSNPHTLALLLAQDRELGRLDGIKEAKLTRAREQAERVAFIDRRVSERRATADSYADGPVPATAKERYALISEIANKVITDTDLFDLRDTSTPVREVVDAVARRGLIPDTEAARKMWTRMIYSDFVHPRLQAHSASERVGTMSTGPYGGK